MYLARLLWKHGGGISPESFAAYFKSLTEDRLKYELYGYGSLEEFFENVKDVCRVEKTRDQVLLYPLASAPKRSSTYRLDRTATAEQEAPDVIRKEDTSYGEVIVLDIEDRSYVPTCSLAKVAGFATDRVLEILAEDGLKVTGLRYLFVGRPEDEDYRLKIALWCPLARTETDQIKEVSLPRSEGAF